MSTLQEKRKAFQESFMSSEDTTEESVVETNSQESSEVVEENEVVNTEDTLEKEDLKEDSSQDDSEGFFTFSEVGEEDEEEVQQVSQVVKKSSVKVSLDEYIKSNEESLKKYFKYKDLDLDNLTEEQILYEGLKKKNPYWTSEDIKEELKDEYGVGLKLKQVTDDMTEEEEAEVMRHNELVEDRIRRGQRRLKADALIYKKELQEVRDSLSLPELETEVEVSLDSPDKSLEQVQKEYEEWRETQWVPEIEKSVAKVKGIRKVVKVNMDEGVSEDLTLSYSLTDSQKNELQEYMKNYIDQPSDMKFVNSETGQVDYDSLVQEKAIHLFSGHIISSMVKEGIAKLKGEFVKNRLVNYEDTTTNSKPVVKGEETAEDIFRRRAEQRRARHNAFSF